MINLDIQIELIIFSFLFGMLYRAGIIFFDKYIHHKTLSVINSIGYILLATLLYFYNIEKIASGVLHPYSLLLIILGYYLFKPIENGFKKWYINFGDIMKITPQARRRLLVFGSASIIIMVFFVFLTVSYIKTVSSLNTELNRLNLLLVQLENRNEDLQIEITRLHDPEYLARYVRENYDYSKDGELIIKINETNKSIDTLNEKEYSNKLFLIIISIIFIFMIFIYIIFKSKSVKKPITKK